jgi:hypothetical protein
MAVYRLSRASAWEGRLEIEDFRDDETLSIPNHLSCSQGSIAFSINEGDTTD